MRLSRLAGMGIVFCALGFAPMGRATSCTTQAEMTGVDRDAIAAVSQKLANAVVQQDFATLQSSLLSAVAQQWQGIHDAVEQGAGDVKGGTAQIRTLYLLDATTLTAPADTQFFCTSGNASLTVTISMNTLPPGRYAVAIADVPQSQLAGQIGFILGWEANTWRVGGLFVRPGKLDGHDSVWYWQHGRELGRANEAWAAYYSYDAARYLALPVNFLSSNNLDRLAQEQNQLKNGPSDAFPLTVTAGDRSWKIQSIRFDPTLRQADLGVTYESAGVTDPAAQRTEAIAVMSALLKAKPAMRQTFHGLWAYSAAGTNVTPVMELPMGQIP